MHWRTLAGEKRKHYIMSQEFYHFTVNTPTRSIGVGCDEETFRFPERVCYSTITFRLPKKYELTRLHELKHDVAALCTPWYCAGETV